MTLNAAAMMLLQLPFTRPTSAAERITWLRTYADALLEVDPSGALTAKANELADSLQFALDHGMTV